MEHHLLMGKQTGVRNFMDCIDILSSCLPLFTPKLMSKLTNTEKAAILYDALPHYCIKKTKEAYHRLDELLSYDLNIQESAVNPGTDDEGKSNNSNVKKTETTIPRKQGGGKGKKSKKSGVSHLLFLMVKKYQLVLFVEKMVTFK
jgi:hypothetical protein